MASSSWQLTKLVGPRPALLSHDDAGWSVVLDGRVVAGRSLDEAVDRALAARTVRRRGPALERPAAR